MPSLTVRNLPEETHRALRVRAALLGGTTEAEVRTDELEIPRPRSDIQGTEF